MHMVTYRRALTEASDRGGGGGFVWRGFILEEDFVRGRFQLRLRRKRLRAHLSAI